MGTTLAGVLPKNDYKDLLQLGNTGTGVTGGLLSVCDGSGNATPLQLSTTSVGLGGTIVSAPLIGNFALAQLDASYKKCNGQTLTQASFTTLFGLVGILPSFTHTLSTVLPNNGTAGMAVMAYSSALGIYVGISTNAALPNIWVSTDLVNWNAANTANITGTPNDIAWASTIGKFVMTTTAGNTCVYVSSDGFNWALSQVFADAIVQYVCASPTLFVVGGVSDLDNSILTSVYTSTDGISWTQRTLAGSAGFSVTALHFSSALSLFFVGGQGGQIQTSPDGITWTSRTSNTATTVNAFASFASLVVAVGNTGNITTSPTGVTWTLQTVLTTSNLNGVAYSPTATVTWIAAGAGNVILQSTNGTTWNLAYCTQSLSSGLFWSGTKYVKLGFVTISTSTDLISWTAQTSALATANAAYRSGAFGNSAYVIVADSGAIQSSTDAVTWTSRTSNTANSLNHVVYVAGSTNLFIAVGNTNTITTSPDGTTWTVRTANVTGTFAAVAFKTGTDVMVAVASGGTITRSTNGTTWSSQTSPTTNSLAGVAWNGTIFCAVGSSGTSITSPDGVTWTKQRPSGLGASAMGWVTSDGTNFYALVTTQPYCYVSSDGITWTRYPTPLQFQGLNFMNGLLVGYDTDGQIATSTNGQTWTVKSIGAIATYAKCYWVSPNFIVCSPTVGVLTSTTGLTFNSQNGSLFNGIAYSSSLVMLAAVGAQGAIMTSTNGGSSWTQVFSFSAAVVNSKLNFVDIAWSPSLAMFCAVANSGMIVTSTDGVTWTQQSFASVHWNDLPAGGFQSIAWSVAQSLFVAVGAAGVIATSANGTAWTERTSGIGVTLNQVCYNASLTLWVVVGNNGAVLTSTNGTTWTSRPTGFIYNLVAVASLEANGFVAGSLASVIGQLFSSADGITWQHKFGVHGSFGKGMYSSTDGYAFFPCTAAGVNATADTGLLVGTSDGKTFQYFGTAMSVPMNALAYDSVDDKYVVVGNSAYVSVLSRTYNKATQFALPTIQNTWVKASA